MKKNLYYLMVLATLLFAACSEADEIIDVIDLPAKETKTLLILSEGSWQHNNSTLAWYNLASGAVDKDYFRSVNKRGLGDTGNDILKYGSKVYIVVNTSSTIEVIASATGKSIKQIPMKKQDGGAKSPRYIAAYGGNVYVTSYDDTVTRIDTTNLSVTGSLEVGKDPDGICIHNNKIYVANSGGHSGFDNTVSVLNLTAFTKEKDIEVGLNPFIVQADSQGDIYVTVRGNYGDVSASFKRIDAKTGEVKTIEGIEGQSKFVIHDNKAYIIDGAWGKPYSVKVYDCLNEKLISNNFISDGTKLSAPYGISVDKYNGDIFITESDYKTPGSVFCFSKDGKLKYKLENVGMNPTGVAFI